MLSARVTDPSVPLPPVHLRLPLVRVLAAALPLLVLVLAPPAAGPAWQPGLELLATAAWLHCTLGPLRRRP